MNLPLKNADCKVQMNLTNTDCVVRMTYAKVNLMIIVIMRYFVLLEKIQIIWI